MKISWKGYAAFQESTGLGVTIAFFFLTLFYFSSLHIGWPASTLKDIVQSVIFQQRGKIFVTILLILVTYILRKENSEWSFNA